MGYRLDRLAGNLGRKLIRWAARDSNMLRHAKDEWAIAFPEPEEMQDLVRDCVFDCVSIFSLDGHSGFSAGYTIPLIEKSLRFEPISALRGTDDEWVEVGSSYGGPECWQNKRCSRVFKDSRDGPAYDIDGKVFVEPNGTCYSSSESRVFIEFPYFPTNQNIPVDEHGEPILENHLSAHFTNPEPQSPANGE